MKYQIAEILYDGQFDPIYGSFTKEEVDEFISGNPRQQWVYREIGDELKPCPFCGSEAKHYYRYDDTGWANTDWVSCESEDCGCQTCLHENKELAIAAWNRRITDPTQSA